MPVEESQDDQRFDAGADENLTAYLDGELDAEAAGRVEARLAADAEVRQRLNALQQAWDSLDELPQPSVDEDFTRTTIEMVAIAASEDVQREELANERRRQARKLLAVLGSLLCLLAGFAVAAGLLPDENRAVVEDLVLLENLDLYLQVEDIEYLRALNEQAWLHEPRLADAGSIADPLAVRDEGSMEERRRRIEAMSPEKKGSLARRREQFENLSPARQQQVRALHAAIWNDPKRDELLATLARYYQWVRQLSPGARYDLMQLPIDERLAAMTRLRREQVRRDAIELSPADREAVTAWLLEFALRHREEILRGIQDVNRRQMVARAMQMLGRQPQENAQQRLVQMLAMAALERGRRGAALRLPEFTDEDLSRLAERLSPAARQTLRETPVHQRRLVLAWIGMTVRERFSAAMLRRADVRISGEELERFFEDELNSSQREQLLSLPLEEWKTKLREMYLASKHGLAPAQKPGNSPNDRGARPRMMPRQKMMERPPGKPRAAPGQGSRTRWKDVDAG